MSGPSQLLDQRKPSRYINRNTFPWKRRRLLAADMKYTGVLSAEITGRAARDSLRVVSPSDFQITQWRPCYPRDLRHEAIPYCLDVHNRRSLYVNAGRRQAIARAKLQYAHLRERATTLFSIPWEHGRLFERAASPVRFAFSVGRCGSTLFVEAIRRGGTIALSEPDFFTQAVATRIHAGPVFPEYSDLVSVLSNLASDLLSALSNPSAPGVIKLRTECCKAPDVIVATQASPATVFLIREFGPWANSTLRASALSPQRLVQRYVEGVRCLGWLKRNTDCHLLSYEDFIADPVGTLDETAAALGVVIDPAGANAALKTDAQAGTSLSQKRLAGRAQPPAAILARALDLWMETRPTAVLREVGLAKYC
jgi:hypothetical protein